MRYAIMIMIGLSSVFCCAMEYTKEKKTIDSIGKHKKQDSTELIILPHGYGVYRRQREEKEGKVQQQQSSASKESPRDKDSGRWLP